MFVLRRPEVFAALPLAAWLTSAFLLGGAPSVSVAQGVFTGALHGSAFPVPAPAGARDPLTVLEVESGRRLQVSLDRDGSFLVPGLAPGEYLLLGAGRNATPILIEPGVVSEVTVGETSAPDPGLDTLSPDQDDDGLRGSGALSPVLGTAAATMAGDRQTLNQVPQGAGSDPAPNPAEDADSAEQTTGAAHGLARGRHAGVPYTFAQASVREFQTGIGSYSAAQGGAGSGLTRTTREGGVKFHGSVSFSLRSSALAARNPLSIATTYTNGQISSVVVKPHDLLTDGGFSAGGPVPATRWLHYFGAVEVQRRGYPAISSPANPNFYRLTAIQSALLATRGVPPGAIKAGLEYVSSVTGTTPRRADQDVEFLRLDGEPRGWLQTGVEANRVRWNAPAGLLASPVVARGRASLGNALVSLDQVLVRLAVARSTRTSAHLHLSYTGDVQYERPQTALPQEPAIGPGGLVPEVNIGPDGILFGTPASLSQQAWPDEHRLAAAASGTLLRKNHLLQLGAEIAYVQERAATLANAAGTFHYDSGETKGFAGGLVDFLTDSTFNVHQLPDGGCPSIASPVHDFCFRTYSQSFGTEQVEFSTQDWSGFVEDTWRPLRRLTLHAGVRYDYTLLPLPQHPNSALDAVFTTFGSTSVFPEDRNNFGPRFSVAAEPFGRPWGTVQLGYGAYYGRIPGATIKAALTDTALASSTTRIRIRPATEVLCPQQSGAGFGYPCSFTSAPPGVTAATTSALLFDRHFRLPLVQQASLAWHRELGEKSSITLGYILNLDRQLPGSTDLNIAPSTSRAMFQLEGGAAAKGVQDGQTFSLPLYTARVSPQFGAVTGLVSHSNATWNAFQVHVSTRALAGLLGMAEYTFSKALDFGQPASATPRTDSQLDPFTLGYDKGLSSLNSPHAFHAELEWTLPRERLAFFSGWSLAVLTTARSGRPYSYDLSGGTHLAGGHASLNGSGGALYLPTVGRNTLHLPPIFKTDASASRDFRLLEHLRGRASVEITNLLNQQIVASLNQRAFLVGKAIRGITPLVFQDANTIALEGLNTTPFGTSTATGTAQARERQILFRLIATF